MAVSRWLYNIVQPPRHFPVSFSIDVGQHTILDAGRYDHETCILADRSGEAVSIGAGVFGSMPGTDKLLSLAMKWSAEMETYIGDRTRPAIDLVGKDRTSKEVDGFRPFIRNLNNRTQWNFHIDTTFLTSI